MPNATVEARPTVLRVVEAGHVWVNEATRTVFAAWLWELGNWEAKFWLKEQIHFELRCASHLLCPPAALRHWLAWQSRHGRGDSFNFVQLRLRQTPNHQTVSFALMTFLLLCSLCFLRPSCFALCLTVTDQVSLLEAVLLNLFVFGFESRIRIQVTRLMSRSLQARTTPRIRCERQDFLYLSLSHIKSQQVAFSYLRSPCISKHLLQ